MLSSFFRTLNDYNDRLAVIMMTPASATRTARPSRPSWPARTATSRPSSNRTAACPTRSRPIKSSSRVRLSLLGYDPVHLYLIPCIDFATACASNTSVSQPPAAADVALQLPANWDGPFGQSLGTPATVIGVIVTFALGVGAITVVNTM